jgi:hypothetical protein
MVTAINEKIEEIKREPEFEYSLKEFQLYEKWGTYSHTSRGIPGIAPRLTQEDINLIYSIARFNTGRGEGSWNENNTSFDCFRNSEIVILDSYIRQLFKYSCAAILNSMLIQVVSKRQSKTIGTLQGKMCSYPPILQHDPVWKSVFTMTSAGNEATGCLSKNQMVSIENCVTNLSSYIINRKFGGYVRKIALKETQNRYVVLLIDAFVPVNSVMNLEVTFNNSSNVHSFLIKDSGIHEYRLERNIQITKIKWTASSSTKQSPSSKLPPLRSSTKLPSSYPSWLFHDKKDKD